MSDEAKICPLCGASGLRDILEAADINQRIEGTFRLARCSSCGIESINPIPDLDTLKRHYPAQYYPQSPEIILSDQTNRAYQDAKIKLVSQYAKPGRILDVGTGTRGLLKFFADAGWETVGTEFSEHAANFARRAWGLDIRVGPIESHKFDVESFDVVTFWHVLEHLSNPKIALDESRRILRKGGILVVAVPNIASLQAIFFRENWYHLDLPRHIYHFSPQSAKRLIEGAGFEILDISYRSEEHNWAGWEFSLIPPDPESRRNVSRFVQKNWARLSRVLARIEEMIGRGGTFTLIARRF